MANKRGPRGGSRSSDLEERKRKKAQEMASEQASSTDTSSGYERVRENTPEVEGGETSDSTSNSGASGGSDDIQREATVALQEQGVDVGQQGVESTSETRTSDRARQLEQDVIESNDAIDDPSQIAIRQEDGRLIAESTSAGEDAIEQHRRQQLREEAASQNPFVEAEQIQVQSTEDGQLRASLEEGEQEAVAREQAEAMQDHGLPTEDIEVATGLDVDNDGAVAYREQEDPLEHYQSGSDVMQAAEEDRLEQETTKTVNPGEEMFEVRRVEIEQTRDEIASQIEEENPNLERGEDFEVQETTEGLRVSMDEETRQDQIRRQIASQNENIEPEDVQVSAQPDTYPSGGDARLAAEADSDGDDLRQTTYGISLSEDARRRLLHDAARQENPDAERIEVVETDDGDLGVEIDQGEEFGDFQVNVPGTDHTFEEGLEFSAGVVSDKINVVGEAAGDVAGGVEDVVYETEIPLTGQTAYETVGLNYSGESPLERTVEGGTVGVLQLANTPAMGLATKEGIEYSAWAGDQIARGQGGEAYDQTAMAGTQAVAAGIDYAQANPLRTTGLVAGSLAGSYGAISGAARVSPQAGRAAAYAIQPGEEIAIGAASRAPVIGSGVRALRQDPTGSAKRMIQRANRRADISTRLSNLRESSPRVRVTRDADAGLVEVDSRLFQSNRGNQASFARPDISRPSMDLDVGRPTLADVRRRARGRQYDDAEVVQGSDVDSDRFTTESLRERMSGRVSNVGSRLDVRSNLDRATLPGRSGLADEIAATRQRFRRQQYADADVYTDAGSVDSDRFTSPSYLDRVRSRTPDVTRPSAPTRSDLAEEIASTRRRFRRQQYAGAEVYSDASAVNPERFTTPTLRERAASRASGLRDSVNVTPSLSRPSLTTRSDITEEIASTRREFRRQQYADAEVYADAGDVNPDRFTSPSLGERARSQVPDLTRPTFPNGPNLAAEIAATRRRYRRQQYADAEVYADAGDVDPERFTTPSLRERAESAAQSGKASLSSARRLPGELTVRVESGRPRSSRRTIDARDLEEYDLDITADDGDLPYTPGENVETRDVGNRYTPPSRSTGPQQAIQRSKPEPGPMARDPVERPKSTPGSMMATARRFLDDSGPSIDEVGVESVGRTGGMMERAEQAASRVLSPAETEAVGFGVDSRVDAGQRPRLDSGLRSETRTEFGMRTDTELSFESNLETRTKAEQEVRPRFESRKETDIPGEVSSDRTDAVGRADEEWSKRFENEIAAAEEVLGYR
jgi:hypothetical protein